MTDSTRTKLWWTGLVSEKLLGLLFVVAAALKAYDFEAFVFQIRYYHIVEAPAALWAAAIGSVAWETLLGVAMLVGLRLRGWTFAAVAATLAGFTGLIVYAWYYHDIQDCGCFGSLVPLGPGSTSAKNAAMFAMTLLAWFGLHSGHAHIVSSLWQHPYVKVALSAAACLLVTLAGLFHVPFDRLAAHQQHNETDGRRLIFTGEHDGQIYDTSEGEYFVAFLSDSCEECRAEAPLLNDMLYIPEMPTVIAFMFVESETSFEEFRQLAEFPAIPMDLLEWVQYIHRAPPRFYLVRDGKEITHWDEHLPPLEEILAVLEGGADQLHAEAQH